MTIKPSSHFDSKNEQTCPQLLVLANFITCLPREIPRDIAFIPCEKMAGIVNKVCFIQVTYIQVMHLSMSSLRGTQGRASSGDFDIFLKNESNSLPQGQHN